MNAQTCSRAAENADRHLRSAYRHARARARCQDADVDVREVREVIRAAIRQQSMNENERGN